MPISRGGVNWTRNAKLLTGWLNFQIIFKIEIENRLQSALIKETNYYIYSRSLLVYSYITGLLCMAI